MRPLTKIGWFTLAVGWVILGIVFIAHNGMNDPMAALLWMLGHLVWGGIILGGLLFILMAVLFLSA
ncbi:MAG: hypothetical protein Q8P05_06220 [Candidatus Diapherotrites archaeon]|nr:hypothetical protein [Candidatus Diapherotrites archaeon]MDZ4256253.1 hypothetical protein [archaeon]